MARRPVESESSMLDQDNATNASPEQQTGQPRGMQIAMLASVALALVVVGLIAWLRSADRADQQRSLPLDRQRSL